MSRNIEREDGADLGVFSVHICSIFCGASSKHSTLFYFIYFILQFIFFVHRISNKVQLNKLMIVFRKEHY